MNRIARRSFAAVSFVVASTLVGVQSAFAAATPVDVADVVANIGAQIAPITAIGGAVLSVLVAAAAFKWIKRAF